jgi:hypothetical protein
MKDRNDHDAYTILCRSAGHSLFHLQGIRKIYLPCRKYLTRGGDPTETSIEFPNSHAKRAQKNNANIRDPPAVDKSNNLYHLLSHATIIHSHYKVTCSRGGLISPAK